jgi:predicted metal-dependent phosphotriesterase family hydrolase
MPTIMTVRGPIDSSDLGFTLPHEHVLVDFGGAQSASPDRYDRDDVVLKMLPNLNRIREAGVRGFVDCSPMYLARDVEVLSRLAEATGLHIITNTGQYKEPYLPPQTFELSAEELALTWIKEWENGIDGTAVRPGFIKTAVEPEKLAPIQQKVITAAALTCRSTGMTIGTHTCAALPALEILHILETVGVPPSKWIFIHANAEEDHEMLRVVARTGCWIELDGLGSAPDKMMLTQVLKLLDWGFADRILLSHDAGWYTVGEPGGGTPRPYTHLTETFIPLMRRVGIDDQTVARITVENPAQAFSITD